MAPTIRTVVDYSTHQEHSVDFFGNKLLVTVTRTASIISQWIRNIEPYNRRPYSSHPFVVGVGVQWTPAGYHSGYPRDSSYSDGSYYGDSSPGNYNGNAPRNSYYSNPPPANNYAVSRQRSSYADPSPRGYNVDPEADTLQLCVGNRCLIIQLSHCDRVPDELRSLLADPETIYFGVWNHQDARKLAGCRHRLVTRKLLDIKDYVKDSTGRSMSDCSFEAIVKECMGYHGVRLDGEISMSDWSVYNLCNEQILQASLDAYVCAQIGVWLRG
ncbi:unnamed protein product [Microthlaspi erraticum]|uniref:3'-5' exonuclease domain-containing protein n=1 Tax=Microthlaspi erraticum TaxID=1685480 RepID=A0A6D2HJC4_9BRAS|nr:unnamed protein product [Microthlaspi erraticum]